ncbi:glutamine amidotransferase [Amycolatopsis sp. NPDC005232]|uniref:glutamine amidotransferase n=1 Tax=Amycolatopsis sp. NPDC005232 TaxID=3157027 RepID=UPI0033BDA031
MTKRALAVRHVAFEDLGLLSPLLLARGYTVDYLEAGVDPITPELLSAPDVVVVLGGPIGVGDTALYPFLPDELTSIATRLSTGRPTLGICLGAQLIAAALGSDVTPTGKKEIGYSPLGLTPAGRDSVLSPLDGVPVLHWHGDQFAIPAGSTTLAETPGFPRQAFSPAPGTLALQFHLEADHTRLEPWLIGHTFELATAGVDPRTLRADAATHGPTLARAAQTVFTTWLDEAEQVLSASA